MKKLSSPFFELGPKTYFHGERAMQLALAADRYSQMYDVDVIFTAQYTDIPAISRAVQRVRVYAQHMDPLRPGRGIGAVLPEAIRDAGAVGVMLNHAERPLTMPVLEQTLVRAKEVGLETIVCAATPEEAVAIAELEPTVVLVESPLLIEAGARTPEQLADIRRINEAIHRRVPDARILHGAGIHDENDVYQIIAAGAEATGSTSGVMCAEDPEAMLERMLKAVRDAWNLRHAANP